MPQRATLHALEASDMGGLGKHACHDCMSFRAARGSPNGNLGLSTDVTQKLNTEPSKLQLQR